MSSMLMINELPEIDHTWRWALYKTVFVFLFMWISVGNVDLQFSFSKSMSWINGFPNKSEPMECMLAWICKCSPVVRNDKKCLRSRIIFNVFFDSHPHFDRKYVLKISHEMLMLSLIIPFFRISFYDMLPRACVCRINEVICKNFVLFLLPKIDVLTFQSICSFCLCVIWSVVHSKFVTFGIEWVPHQNYQKHLMMNIMNENATRIGWEIFTFYDVVYH